MDHPIPIFLSPEARMEPVTAAAILRRSAASVPGLEVADGDDERGIDPTTAVALISGLSTIISTAIPLLVQIWSREKKRTGKIVLALADDSRIEIETGEKPAAPADVSAITRKDQKVVAIYLS